MAVKENIKFCAVSTSEASIIARQLMRTEVAFAYEPSKYGEGGIDAQRFELEMEPARWEKFTRWLTDSNIRVYRIYD